MERNIETQTWVREVKQLRNDSKMRSAADR